MFKYSRVSCTPIAPPDKGGPERVELGPEEVVYSRTKPARQNRGRRRNMSRRKTQVEPTVSKPHDAPMSKSDLYFALDCEMVGVGPDAVDSALARVCIVNWENEVVLDTHVKVSVPVTDYRTYVSGVRPEDLSSPDAMEFEECRLAVKNILCGKILIGHGLENDLNALHLTHPRSDVRDTAAYAPLMRKALLDDKVVLWPRKLRDLAWEKLERQIQVDGKAHSPLEDAITALDLYKSVRPRWEKDLVKESMEKEREAESQRLRLESQMYAASVNPQNMVAHMNGLSPLVPPPVDQRGVPVPQNLGDGYKMYYERGYPPPILPPQYLPPPPPPEAPAPERNVAAPSANYGSPYNRTPPPDVAYPHTVYPQYPAATTTAAPPPPSPQGSSFFRLPQKVLVPVYLFNTKSSRKARRQQQDAASQELTEEAAKEKDSTQAPPPEQ